MQDTSPDFTEARRLFELGYSPRQIAKKVDILPSLIRARALQENWSSANVPNWEELRQRYEQGEELVMIARNCTVSLYTLRKRKMREKWNRDTTGLGALRRSVTALQVALTKTDPQDTVQITKISAALSMAAGRLSQAETGEKTPEAENEITTSSETSDTEKLFKLVQDWVPVEKS
ncbi:hypothetical protein MNBD_ALPHA06-1997 [hydrothermal vent metagenome]|uniref:Uncharacterized protein n=1 Tax=hydrothermal vent metagenome TaxID=652676 RepID=A0A3B0S762_9ZZZZ